MLVALENSMIEINLQLRSVWYGAVISRCSRFLTWNLLSSGSLLILSATPDYEDSRLRLVQLGCLYAKRPTSTTRCNLNARLIRSVKELEVPLEDGFASESFSVKSNTYIVGRRYLTIACCKANYTPDVIFQHLTSWIWPTSPFNSSSH